MHNNIWHDKNLCNLHLTHIISVFVALQYIIIGFYFHYEITKGYHMFWLKITAYHSV